MRRLIQTNFRERNPVPIALIGIALIVGLMYVGLNAGNITLITDRKTYKVEFAEAGGLQPQNEVRIAGVRVGQVMKVGLEGSHVLVTIKVDSKQHLGDQTKAAIKLKTLLGTKYVELTPGGTGTLPSGRIPVARTSVPFQVYDAFSLLAQRSGELDVNKVAQALNVLSDTFADRGGNAQAAIKGLGALSKTIGSRDQQVRSLLANTQKVSAVLAARDGDLVKLLGDADVVLRVVRDRKAVLQALLRDTASLAAQLTSLVRDNRAELDPLLNQLHDVVVILDDNITNLDKSVALLGPTGRYLANAFGSGKWMDVYGENLVISDKLLCALGACAK